MGKILSTEYSFWDTHTFDLTFSLVMVITPTPNFPILLFIMVLKPGPFNEPQKREVQSF